MVASHRPARVRVCEPGTRGALVVRQSVEPVEMLGDGVATLVEVGLETGFLHQIRAVMAARGHPVLGDPTYGPSGGVGAPRQLLHCAHIGVDEVDAASPDPPDLCAALAELRSATRP